MGSQAVRKILIIGHTNLGDVVCDAAVVAPLRSCFPQAEISFLTSPSGAELMNGYTGLDEVICWDKRSVGRNVLKRVHFACRLRAKRYNLAVVLKKTLLQRFLSIPQIWELWDVRTMRSNRARSHPVDRYLEHLRGYGVDVPRAAFGFSWRPEDEIFCDQFLAAAGIGARDRLVAICPMAAWSQKSWPIEKWNELAEALRNGHGIRTIALGRSGDERFRELVRRQIDNRIVSALDGTNLKQAMALMKRCAVFIGPDSGLLHLASCLGMETIGVYGPTPKDYIYPYFHRGNLVSTGADLPCMPCYPGFENYPCKDRHPYGVCMEELDFQRVWDLVKQKLMLG